jgi:hypothetical protein
MASHPQMDGNKAPSPPPSTEKTCYQSRQGVVPTRTTQIGFKNSAEDGEWPMYHGVVMDYTPISGHSPTPMEHGIANEQNHKGYYSNGKGNNI